MYYKKKISTAVEAVTIFMNAR